MFEHRGLSNSHVGVMRFELFRKVFEDVTAFLSQGQARRYTGTFLAGFISFRNGLMLFYSYGLQKGKETKWLE